MGLTPPALIDRSKFWTSSNFPFLSIEIESATDELLKTRIERSRNPLFLISRRHFPCLNVSVLHVFRNYQIYEISSAGWGRWARASLWTVDN